jgi:hypothetical protein
MSVEDAKLLTDAIVWTDGALGFDVESDFQIIDNGIAVYVNGVMLDKDKFIFDSNSRRVEFAGGYSPVAGDHIQVGRDIVPAQENTLSAYSGYNRELFEKMFDRLTLMCVEFKEKLNRALMVNTLAEDGEAAEMVETLSRLPQEISQIQSDLDNLFEDMDANEVEFASLHTAVTSLSNSLANVVTLLNNKAAKNHVHTSADITGINDAFTTLESTLTALTNTINGKADTKHTHSIDDVTDLRNELDKKFVLPSGGNNGQVLAKDASGKVVWTTVESTGGSGGGSDITVDSALSDTSVNPVQNKIVTQSVKQLETNISNLNTAVNGKAPSSHTHFPSDISGFDTAIAKAVAGKANATDVMSLNNSLASHAMNSTMHVSLDEKNAWNNKANAADITALADRVTALESAGGGGSDEPEGEPNTDIIIISGCGTPEWNGTYTRASYPWGNPQVIYNGDNGKTMTFALDESNNTYVGYLGTAPPAYQSNIFSDIKELPTVGWYSGPMGAAPTPTTTFGGGGGGTSGGNSITVSGFGVAVFEKYNTTYQLSADGKYWKADGTSAGVLELRIYHGNHPGNDKPCWIFGDDTGTLEAFIYSADSDPNSIIGTPSCEDAYGTTCTLTISAAGEGSGDVEMPHVVEAYRWRFNDDGGTSVTNYVAGKWYRKWSDGYVEQGGELYSGSSYTSTPNALYTQTLPVPLTKPQLNVSVSDMSGNGAKVHSYSKTSISISVTKDTSQSIFWEVKGYYK